MRRGGGIERPDARGRSRPHYRQTTEGAVTCISICSAGDISRRDTSRWPASISVMLGVATMIVVNSVMAGFADKMRDRLHGVLADVVVESFSLDGFYNWDEVMARIKQVAGDEVKAMAPTMEMPGDPPFPLSNGAGHDPAGPDHRHQARGAGQDRRFRRVPLRRPGQADHPVVRGAREVQAEHTPAGEMLKEIQGDPRTDRPDDRGRARRADRTSRPPTTARSSAMRWRPTTARASQDLFLAPPGTKVGLLFPAVGETKSEAGFDTFTTVGYFKSGMSEYDSTHVYVPLEPLQDRGCCVDARRSRRRQPDPDQGQAGRRPRRAGREDPARPGQDAARRSSGSRPGSRSRARCSGPSPSSRAS